MWTARRAQCGEWRYTTVINYKSNKPEDNKVSIGLSPEKRNWYRGANDGEGYGSETERREGALPIERPLPLIYALLARSPLAPLSLA